jgi:hypothetical protein
MVAHTQSDTKKTNGDTTHEAMQKTANTYLKRFTSEARINKWWHTYEAMQTEKEERKANTYLNPFPS